jgi:ArsR family transcriptional regulator
MATITDRSRTARLFHALSDETRLQILDLLRAGEHCVCDLSSAIGAQQSRLSFHLRTLKEAGLVTDRRQGRWIYYGLRADALEEMGEALRDFQVVTVTGSGDGSCCG